MMMTLKNLEDAKPINAICDLKTVGPILRIIEWHFFLRNLL